LLLVSDFLDYKYDSGHTGVFPLDCDNGVLRQHPGRYDADKDFFSPNTSEVFSSDDEERSERNYVSQHEDRVSSALVNAAIRSQSGAGITHFEA